jgi:hypothetical protein
MTDDQDRGFTRENVFKALLTIKEATETGFARVESNMDALAFNMRSELEQGLSGVERRLGAKIDNLERRVVRIDDRLSAVENQHHAAKVADHEVRIRRLEGP